MSSALSALTGKRRRWGEFVRHYASLGAKPGAGAQAAIRAGYAPAGASVRAAELLAREDVRAALAEIMAPKLKKLDISAERVLAEIAALAFADEDGGTVKPGEKLKALEMLAKHHGLLTDRLEHAGSMEVALSPQRRLARIGHLLKKAAGDG